MKTSSFFSYRGPGRIAISRSVPRGMSAGYRVAKELTPGPWFNSVDRETYTKLYFEEILGKLDPKATWDKLHRLAGDSEPVLLCYERPPFDDFKNYCHRRMVAEWFQDALGVDVPEMTFASESNRGLF